MSKEKDVGKLKGSYYESIQVEWEIPDLFTENGIACFSKYESPIFIFMETAWKLRLSHVYCNKLQLQIFNVGGHDDQEIKCKLSLKKVDGSVKPLSVINETFFLSGFTLPSAFIEKLELWLSRNELAHSNNLIFTCTLKQMIAHSSQPCVMREPAPLKLIKLDKLSENFKSLFADKDSCDVILQVKEKEFHAHKAVLMARSTVFASMFCHDTSENQTGIVSVQDCDPDSFHKFLEFLYCGKLEDISFRSALHLCSTSNKYDVQELKTSCIEYMEHNLTEDNVCDLAVLADQCGDKLFLDAVQDFFDKNIRKIVITTAWESLLKDNCDLANKLLIGMSSKVKIEN